MYWIRKIWVMIGLVLTIICLPILVLANDDEGVGFDIQSIIPKNQLNKKNSYYDLRMKPGEEQKIEFSLNNTSSKDGVYEVNVNQAYTNTQGFIDYSKKVKKPADSLKYNIEDMVEYDKEVKVASDSSIKVPITIKMPKEEFDGQILAGIQVIKKEDENKDVSQISNTYGYILGLKLTETDKEIKRDIKLLNVKPKVSFGKTSVVARLENPTMDSYGHLKYDVIVKQKDQVVREVTYGGDMEMAPTSIYDFAIDWESKRLKAGDYKLLLTVSDAKDNVWKFDEDFTITSKEARKINGITVNKDDRFELPMWAIILLGAVFGVVCLAIGLFIYSKKKKKKKKMKRSSKKKHPHKPKKNKSKIVK